MIVSEENNPLVLTWSQVPHNHKDNKWHGGLQSNWFWWFVMLHVRECYNLQGLSTIYPLHHRHYCSKNIYFGMRANKIIYQEVSFTKHFLLPKILPNLFTAHCEKFVSFKTLSLTSEWMFTISYTVQFHRVVQLKVFLTLERNQNVWTSNITQIFMWLKQIFNVKIFVYC